MKKEVNGNEITLIAETASEARDLSSTSFQTLRQNYGVGKNQTLVLQSHLNSSHKAIQTPSVSGTGYSFRTEN
jgi:hypothetical protein